MTGLLCGDDEPMDYITQFLDQVITENLKS